MKDIAIFFKSSCCNKSKEHITIGGQITNSDSLPCQSYAKHSDPTATSHDLILHDLDLINIKKFFAYYFNINNKSLKVTTITIGNKWIGKLSSDDQYKIFVKDIKKHIKYHSDQSYIYCFELQTNGQLHAHGIELGTSQAQFIGHFHHYGRRNSHNESYQDMISLDGYYKYINKNPEYPYITNVKKSDLAKLNIYAAPQGKISPID